MRIILKTTIWISFSTDAIFIYFHHFSLGLVLSVSTSSLCMIQFIFLCYKLQMFSQFVICILSLIMVLIFKFWVKNLKGFLVKILKNYFRGFWYIYDFIFYFSIDYTFRIYPGFSDAVWMPLNFFPQMPLSSYNAVYIIIIFLIYLRCHFYHMLYFWVFWITTWAQWNSKQNSILMWLVFFVIQLIFYILKHCREKTHIL